MLEILIVVTMLDRKWFLGASLVAAYATATSPQAVVLTSPSSWPPIWPVEVC